jgi:MFS family permease
MKIWGARSARLGVLTLAGAVMALTAPFLDPGDNKLLLAMFMFIPAIFGLLFASLWLLASDIVERTDKREAARAFSNIGAATLAGGMTGGLISKGLAPHLDAKWLIFLASVVIFGVVPLVRYIHSRFPSNLVAQKTDGEKKTGFFAPLKNNYALTLLLISMTGALSGLLIDFQFYATARAQAWVRRVMPISSPISVEF